MHRWLLLLLINWGAIQLALMLQPARETAWDTLAAPCNNGHACWLGISAATTTAEKAKQQILRRSGELVVSEAPGQNIQWTHPEGYRGMMLFNRSSVSFLEVNFPRDLSDRERVEVGDVFLVFGQPDVVERHSSEEMVLYFYTDLLIVRVQTVNKDRISPHDNVTIMTMPSPYGSWMGESRQNNRRQRWFGFGTLPTSSYQ